MQFISYGFFLFVFIAFVLYYSVPGKLQWPVLLVASYVFYFFFGPKYVIYIFTTTITTWYAAVSIEKQRNKQKQYLDANKEGLTKEEKKKYKAGIKKKQERIAIACILLNLGILAVVKYTNFAILNINYIMDMTGGKRLGFVNFVLPMGISFYTFRAISYLVDAKRGTITVEKNPFKLALFVSFFPQLAQGPISRYGQLSDSLFRVHRFDSKKIAFGLQRIMWGFMKKLVVADRMVVGLQTLTSDTFAYRGAYVFVEIFFYAIQLYADFSGGIDIAIGVGELFGVELPENFNRPFFSKSIKEYWNRWHITMGTWFTDYIFYPVSISQPMLKLSKWSRAHLGNVVGKRVPVYLSAFLVWLATGVWHGASWNFVFWGLSNWLVIMISQELEPLYRKFHARYNVSDKTAFKAFQIIRTFMLMGVLRMYDCFDGVRLTWRMLGSMLTEGNWNILCDGSLLHIGLSVVDYIVLGCAILLMFLVSMVQRSGSVREKIYTKPYPVKLFIWLGLFVAVLLTGAYGIGYDATSFIYNQF